MPIHNSDIADIFNQTADLLEIRADNPFRIRAYRNAARTIQSLSKNVSQLLSEDADLTRYPGIGRDLAGKVEEIVRIGTFKLLKKLKKQLPEELSELMNITGLGAKRVAKIYRDLDISSLEQLTKALDSGKIRELEGFGKKTEQNIRDEIERLEKEPSKRNILAVAEEIAQPLITYLKKAKGIKDIEVAGSFRRRKDTVRDLDILVTCRKSSNIMDHFTSYEDVQKVVSRGKTKSTVLLRSNFQVDVRVVQQVSFGSALVYFTGSKEHNIAIRKIGIQKKLKLNEYGVFKGKKRVAGKTESNVYKKIGLKFIEPELRENRGEIEAAQKDNLPKLIKLNDIKGDLHVHSRYTDGHNTIEEMAKAAKKNGYEYIAITDHSKHVTVAGGLKPKGIRKQLEEIDKINEKLKGFTILKGTEVDILENGSLDLPDEILKELDLRICAIHYKFNLSKKKQTERIIRAMDNPYFNILAHPTGRLINERSAYEIDMEQIFKAAKDKGCLLELNAHPDRLDLNDIYCKTAKDIGVKIVISTDAHQTGHLNYMRFGVGQARRGWVQPEDVANTRSVTKLKKLLEKS
jgi:DNA polymerase (family 10)